MTRFVLTALLALAPVFGFVTMASAQDNNPISTAEFEDDAFTENAKPPAKLDKAKKSNDVVPEDEEQNTPKKIDPTPKKNDNYTPKKNNNYTPKKNNYTPKKNNYPKKNNNYTPPKKDDYTPPKKDDYTPPKKNYYSYKKVVCYHPVVCYEYRQEPYTKCVTRYDHCGYPYSAEVTYYRTVKVAVKKLQRVVKYVKVQTASY